MLSHLNIGRDPKSCLRFWRSFVDLRISPLHTKFHSPLSHSSELVSRAFHQFLAAITFNLIHRQCAFYAQSFRRTLAPPSYRGCWHGVSRGFFLESCHDRALDERALQAALPFFTHAILLDRAFAHCPRFPTAALRGSPGCVSVPVWLIIQKRPAKHYWLGQPSPDQLPNTTQAHQTSLFRFLQDLARTVRQIPTRYAPVRHFVLNCSHLLGETRYLYLGASFPSAQLLENNVRLACVKNIASVPSEPGSNSSFEYDWALQW
ncbi:uncharacterized protein LOC125875808 [Solanum stenotomum]|uniref:uncharacterized protein LOC125875808 n=1 Tax=Solanum stenotomum TaxID=172797 RepID=UPI0020D1E687|nr:uncharacterized protein LOC125875808 [Solanum stenotomum]